MLKKAIGFFVLFGCLRIRQPGNKTVALNWINWYLNHLNTANGSVPDGSVFRYYINTSTNQEYSTVSEATSVNPTATPTPQGYDSTDSYAATNTTGIE